MTMLSINGCLLLLLASVASLGSAQPKSLNEPILQPHQKIECYSNFCNYYITGEFDILKEISFRNFFFQMHLRLVITLPLRYLSVSRISWTAMVTDPARLASVRLSPTFAPHRRRLCLLRQNLWKYLKPILRQRKILSWQYLTPKKKILRLRSDLTEGKRGMLRR